MHSQAEPGNEEKEILAPLFKGGWGDLRTLNITNPSILRYRFVCVAANAMRQGLFLRSYTFKPRHLSSKLGRPTFFLGSSCFELGRPTFLLGSSCFELGRPTFLLGSSCFELGRPSFLLEASCFELGRPSFFVETLLQ